MLRKKRREVLVGLGAAATAGCTGTSRRREADSDGGSPERSRRELVDARVTIREDEWKSWSFSTTRPATLAFEFDVKVGPAVDAFVTSKAAFRKLRAGEQFDVYTARSMYSPGGTFSVDVPAGSHVLILDNSNVGIAEPPDNFDSDPVEVEISADLTSN